MSWHVEQEQRIRELEHQEALIRQAIQERGKFVSEEFGFTVDIDRRNVQYMRDHNMKVFLQVPVSWDELDKIREWFGS